MSHWDTADVYGDGQAEGLIGSVWDSVPRDRVFLASKVGWDGRGYPHAYDPQSIRDRAERSLRNLRTDVLDLYYLHHCDFGRDDRYLEGAIKTLEELQHAGKVRFLGLSDWSARKLVRVARLMEPDVVQAYRNVLDDDYAESGLASWVAEKDAGVAFFSPLKHGLLLGKYETPVEFPNGDMRAAIPEFGDEHAIRRIREACGRVRHRFKEHSQPVLHALTGYLLADAPTASILVGQRNPVQAEAAAAVGQPLTPEEAAWVREIYSPGA